MLGHHCIHMQYTSYTIHQPQHHIYHALPQPIHHVLGYVVYLLYTTVWENLELRCIHNFYAIVGASVSIMHVIVGVSMWVCPCGCVMWVCHVGVSCGCVMWVCLYLCTTVPAVLPRVTAILNSSSACFSSLTTPSNTSPSTSLDGSWQGGGPHSTVNTHAVQVSSVIQQ